MEIYAMHDLIENYGKKDDEHAYKWEAKSEHECTTGEDNGIFQKETWEVN